MTLGSLIAWIIIGGLAGWIASIVMKTNAEQGLILDIVVGIIGAFIGGFVLDAIGVGGAQGTISIASFGTAFIGAVVLLGLLRLVRR